MQLNLINVLVVEDMDVIRKIIVEQLRKMGFIRLYQAENSRRAMELLESHAFDLILLDWSMPGGNADELLAAIRNNPLSNTIKVILVTANTHRNMIEEAIRYGVSTIIAKPFTTALLQQRVLQVVKEIGTGTAATIELAEFAATPEEITAANNRDSQDAERNSVLVVDDASSNLAFIVGILKVDYKVQFAKNGEAALQICQSVSPPDLVLLDIMMPDMDGFEVIKLLKLNPNTAHIPVIFVTALAENAQHIHGLQSGAVDYLVKPVQPEILKLRVANLLATVNLQRGLQASYDSLLALSQQRDSAEELIFHDLKAPLVMANAQLQRLSQDKLCPKEWKPKLTVLNELVLQSIKTVNLSAEILKIEMGHFVLKAQRFSLHSMVRDILNTMHITFHHKHLVAFHFPDEDPNAEFDVLADPTLTYSLLINLLKNAFEAAKLRTKVAVHFATTASQVSITITNTGVVPPQIREQFWEKYSTHDKINGTGMGTYSARLLAIAQHGETELKVDDANDATHLIVRLPIAKTLT